MLVYPTMDSVKATFPNIDPQFLKDDICYPAMMTLLPTGVFGLVVAGLIAAYTSTIGTHLNWGSSYVVNDFYKRFLKPNASEKELVMMGRISTVILMVLAGGVALLMTNAKDSFNLMLQIGAGTGLIYILRWFWWRINPWTEISAMTVSFLVAIGFFLLGKNPGWVAEGHWILQSHWQLCLGIAITTVCWLIVTFATAPVDDATLRNFVRKTRPGGPGWTQSDCGRRRSSSEAAACHENPLHFPRMLHRLGIAVLHRRHALWENGASRDLWRHRSRQPFPDFPHLGFHQR